jgi:hypothetical protein
MKSNIKKWPFNTTTSSSVSFWYSWTEYCDRCGKLIHDNDYQTSTEPDINEKDYCIDCLRELLKEKHT